MTLMSNEVVCDNCKKAPTPFDVNDCPDKGYFFRVEKSGEVVSLMSDLTYSFCMVPERNPEPEEGYEYWCESCIQSVMDEIDDEKKEGWS